MQGDQRNASNHFFQKRTSRGSCASEAPGSRPAASQLLACPASSVGPPRCRCPGAPAAPMTSQASMWKLGEVRSNAKGGKFLCLEPLFLLEIQWEPRALRGAAPQRELCNSARGSSGSETDLVEQLAAASERVFDAKLTAARPKPFSVDHMLGPSFVSGGQQVFKFDDGAQRGLPALRPAGQRQQSAGQLGDDILSKITLKAQEAEAHAAPAEPKWRGRPPGSKNKPKQDVPTEPAAPKRKPKPAGSPGPRCSGRSWSPRPAAARRRTEG